MCPKDVKEQMMIRLDGIGKNYESLKAKAVSHTFYKAEQNLGGQESLTCLCRSTT